MRSGGALVGTFGWLVGIGPGAGMGLMFVFTSIAGTLVCLAGYLYVPCAMWRVNFRMQCNRM